MKPLKIKLPFGLNERNSIVHIGEVEGGKNCKCVCPSCRSPLIAVKGSINQHHFKHANTEDCKGGLESAIHMAAKKVILKQKQITLPEYIINSSKEDSRGIIHTESIAIAQNAIISFDLVQEEVELHQMRADILAIKRDVKLIIEVFYRHKVDDVKIEKIKQCKISCVEIDLSDLEPADLENWGVFELCINDSNRIKWLYNAKAEACYSQLETNLKDSIQKKEELYKQEDINKQKQAQIDKDEFFQAKNNLNSFRSGQNILQFNNEAESHPAWKRFSKYLQHSLNELPNYLNVDVTDGDWIYGCDRRIWQSIVYLYCIFQNNDVRHFTVQRVDDWLKRKAGLKIPQEVEIIERYSTCYPGLVSPALKNNIPSSCRTLRAYFYHLCDLGLLSFAGNAGRNQGNCWFQIVKKEPDISSRKPTNIFI